MSWTWALAAVGVIGLSAGCGSGPSGGPASSPSEGGESLSTTPVEITLSAAELARAFDADEAAYKTKFGGKWVELTGVVDLPRIRAGVGQNDVLLHGMDKPKHFFAQYVSVTPRKADRDKYEGLRALAKGQSITVRGQVATFGVVLTECEFVTVGPSPALPVVPSELPAALGTPEGKAKYDGKAVVTRGEVREAKWNGTVATLTLGDPGKKSGPALEASLNPQEKQVGEEMGQIKPGTVVVVLGEGDTLNDGRIWNARVLKNAPEGVTLPGDRK